MFFKGGPAVAALVAVPAAATMTGQGELAADDTQVNAGA
jgi:hypothetical protein